MKRYFLFLIVFGITQLFAAVSFARQVPPLEVFVDTLIHRLIEHNHLASYEKEQEMSVEERMAFQEKLGREASVLVMLLARVNGSYVKSQVEARLDDFGRNRVFIEGFVVGLLEEGEADYSAEQFEELRKDVNYQELIERLFFDTIWPAPPVVLGEPDTTFNIRQHPRSAGPIKVPAEKRKKNDDDRFIHEPTVETRPTLSPPLKPNK